NIVCSNKSTSVYIGQVRHINQSPCSFSLFWMWDKSERVLHLPQTDTHPGRATKQSVSLGIGLAQKFRHPIFGMYPGNTQSAFEESMHFLSGPFLPAAFHAARFHNNGIF